MSTVTEELNEYITKYTSPKDLAQVIRRFTNETIKMVLDSKEDIFCKEWIAEGHYYLTNLCEILDPQLKDKEI